MIRALIFDFDGLILDTESALIAAYADVYAAHGIAFDKAHFLRSVGHADYAFDPWHAFAGHADRAGLEGQHVARRRAHYLTLRPLPGVVALFDAARTHGLSLALASNSPHEHCERHLARLGLLDRFQFLACREDVASPKPEPDLYKLVLNHLGLRGHEAIAFEDSHTGSTAAKRAHLRTVACPGPSTRHHDFRHVDLVVTSLTDCPLPALLAKFGP